jgi:hypothetical protein
MIPISLVETPVNIDDYKILNQPESSYVLFLGFIIRNEYDNKRLKLSDNFNTFKFLHVKKENNQIVSCIPLYGLLLTPNDDIKNLIKTLKTQEKVNELSLITYKNIISQYNFSCDNTYSLFSDTVFPIDFHNLKSVCTDTFKDDKKIFQHLLSLDEKHFDFQCFASLKLLILKL